MNNTLREILTDLKAAALIGDPDSIFAAIEQIRATDEEDLPPSALVPLGEALTKLDPGYYIPLLGDDDAAVRGAGAAAAALAWIAGKNIDRGALDFVADDPALEVRAALAQALGRSPEKSAGLIDAWLDAGSDTTRQTALQLLAHLPGAGNVAMRKIEALDSVEDHEFRSVLVETLNALATRGHAEAVLALLRTWAERPEPNVWLITRALSASWSKNHSPAAVGVLKRLAETTGEIRPVLRALERHET